MAMQDDFVSSTCPGVHTPGLGGGNSRDGEQVLPLQQSAHQPGRRWAHDGPSGRVAASRW